jgi:cysteine synthase A
VEPEEAAILSGHKDLRDHKIAGIGDSFVPENLVDQIIAIKSGDAIEMAGQLSRELGLTAGMLSGANVLA